MRFARHRQFDKKLERMPRRLRHAIAERLSLFLEEPGHPLLHDHALTGDRVGQRSINISGDLRVIYRSLDSDTLLLLDIGTHHDLYGT